MTYEDSITEQRCQKTGSDSSGSCSHHVDISKAILSGAEAVSTTCFIENQSLIGIRYNKTPYELMHDKKPDLSNLDVFCSLCYSTSDTEDLGKLKPKADIGIFLAYAPAKKAFRIYNRRTRLIMETIHVTFDELTTMTSKQSSLGPALHEMTRGPIKGATLSMEVDEGETVRSAGLGVATTQTRETTLGGGLKNSSNVDWNNKSQSFLVGET
ncbi:retrovirus-related pol polyprotein from transposon TNT 1-94 [Tanacetum coccineum]